MGWCLWSDRPSVRRIGRNADTQPADRPALHPRGRCPTQRAIFAVVNTNQLPWFACLQVRKAAVQAVAVANDTLEVILSRTRDVNEGVRVAALNVIREKVKVQVLPITIRTQLLDQVRLCVCVSARLVRWSVRWFLGWFGGVRLVYGDFLRRWLFLVVSQHVRAQGVSGCLPCNFCVNSPVCWPCAYFSQALRDSAPAVSAAGVSLYTHWLQDEAHNDVAEFLTLFDVENLEDDSAAIVRNIIRCVRRPINHSARATRATITKPSARRLTPILACYGRRRWLQFGECGG